MGKVIDITICFFMAGILFSYILNLHITKIEKVTQEVLTNQHSIILLLAKDYPETQIMIEGQKHIKRKVPSKED